MQHLGPYIRIILYLLSVTISCHSFAQPPQINQHSNSNFTHYHVITSNEQAVRNHILSKNPGIELQLEHCIESPYGFHYTYTQTHDKQPIYNAQVKVNTSKKGYITSQFSNLHVTPQTNKSAVFPDTSAIHNFLIQQQMKEQFIEVMTIEKIYFDTLSELIPVLKTEITLLNGNAFEWLIDANGKSLRQRNLTLFYNLDSVASGLVFMPDPLTSAMVEYGHPYIDSNDTDIPELNMERANVELKVTYSDSVFSLVNDFVKITEHSSPTTTPATSTNGEFYFNRSQNEFEDVNAFYHITAYQEYVQSLGFQNLANYQIHVDAHAFNNGDNSSFTATTTPPRISFGEGGVDDAEDADVVIHEYMHAIQQSAAPNTNIGIERTAIEEGNCDYIAASYSKDINSYNWENIYSWDGHNEFWDGRSVVNTKSYPDDLVGNIYSDGSIWASTLMEIEQDIGKEQTNKILFQSLFSYATNMSMKDAAQLFIQADSLIYNGAHYADICSRFMSRGLIDNCVVGITETKKQLPKLLHLDNGIVIIQLSQPKNYSVKVYNLLGKLLLTKNGNDNQVIIDHINTGINSYLISLTTEDNVYNYKVVK